AIRFLDGGAARPFSRLRRLLGGDCRGTACLRLVERALPSIDVLPGAGSRGSGREQRPQRRQRRLGCLPVSEIGVGTMQAGDDPLHGLVLYSGDGDGVLDGERALFGLKAIFSPAGGWQLRVGDRLGTALLLAKLRTLPVRLGTGMIGLLAGVCCLVTRASGTLTGGATA